MGYSELVEDLLYPNYNRIFKSIIIVEAPGAATVAKHSL